MPRRFKNDPVKLSMLRSCKNPECRRITLNAGGTCRKCLGPFNPMLETPGKRPGEVEKVAREGEALP